MTETQVKEAESTRSLLNDVMEHVSALLRKEMDLARAEIDQNMRRAAAAIGMLVAAVVIALTALNVLSAAVVAGLTGVGIEAGWSALIVGVALGIVAAALGVKGKNNLKFSSLAPTRTSESLKREATKIRKAVSNG